MRTEESELVIKIPSQSPHAHVTLVQPDGLHKEKDISVEDLVSHLVQNHQFSTGLLPQGTRVYRGTRASYTIAIETPAKMRDFKYHRISDRDRSEVITTQMAFPICLFVFGVRGNGINMTRLYAARNPVQRLEDMLCFFPFGNVYADGNICWGNARLPQIQNPMELVGVINTFFDSVYNGDLFEVSFIRQPTLAEGETRPEDFWSLVRYMDGKQEFPAELLNSNNRTFQAVVGRD